MTGPLDGVTVVDLTAALAGPYCTMILCDLGASVIKVEPPGGEVTRRVGPFRIDGDGRREPLGGYFQSINRGKQSVVLDLRRVADHERFMRLLETADIMVENFTPGVTARLGIDFARVHAAHPRLVYGSLTGFGSPWAGRSPYADWPAMDITVQASAGALSLTGTEEGQPIKIGPGVGDIFPGSLLAVGLLAALRHADRTGEGQQVDIAMYDAVLSLCERLVYQYSYTGEVPRPLGNTHPLLSPFDILPATDGWVAIAAPTQPRWEVLCNIMDRPDLITDDRFVDESARGKNRVAVRALLQDWTAQRSRAELAALLGGRVPFSPVNDARDIFVDPHVEAREMILPVDSATDLPPSRVAGQPLKFSATPAQVGRRAPLLDEHRWQF